MRAAKIFRANQKDWCFPVYLAPLVFPHCISGGPTRCGSHTSSLSSPCPHPSSSSHTVESKMASMMISGLAGARVGPAAVSRKSSVRARAGQSIRMKSFPARRAVELATVASLVAPGGAQSGANLRYASISVRIASRLAPREPARPFPRARLPNHILLIPERGSRPCFRTRETKLITPDPSPRTTTTQAPLRHPPVRRG